MGARSNGASAARRSQRPSVILRGLPNCSDGPRFPRFGILKSVVMPSGPKRQWTVLLVALLVVGILAFLASDSASGHLDFAALLPLIVLSALLLVATGWQGEGEELPCRLRPLPLNVASRAPPTLSIS